MSGFPTLLLPAVCFGCLSGAIAWQVNLVGKRGIGLLGITLLILAQIGMVFGKDIENGRIITQQFWLAVVAYVAVNITFAFIAFYTIRSSELLQRTFYPKWHEMRFSLATLLILMTLIAVGFAFVSILRG